MRHTEEEIKTLKTHHIEMWNLVEGQIEKAFQAFITKDKDLARQVIARERVVNAQELVVDHHCEDFIALFAPVAIDLRFVISLLKINNNLERIGDFAESIALFVLYQQKEALTEELVDKLQIKEMMGTATTMLEKAREALINEDSSLAGKVLSMDDTIDTINREAVDILAGHIINNPSEVVELLHINAVIRRLERIGDRISNIAEDIVFFVDAKELRHQKK
ncbi:MAG: phosphate signaling complex protein PhoU [Rikenellaceae bacterium]